MGPIGEGGGWIGSRGGSSCSFLGHFHRMSKSQRHTRSGAGCGVSQANGEAVTSNFQDGASMRKWNSEEIEAMWGCASKLWVPGRLCVHGRPYSIFAPNSATLQFQVLMSMHMDADV